MESPDRLNEQLHSLEELRTIVRTMKALSAASIHQYEASVKALSGYARAVRLGLHVALRGTAAPPRTDPAPDGKPGLIVFGSDHGLCGRFNDEIADFTMSTVRDRGRAPHGRLTLAVGSRIAASLEQRGQPVEEVFFLPGSARRITATVQQMLLKVDQWHTHQGVKRVDLFYNRHADGSGYESTCSPLLPVPLESFRRLDGPWPGNSLPIFTMTRAALLDRLLHQHLFVSLFRACAESQASEHAARLAAMQSAERNLDDRLQEVTAAHRRARQSAITAELLDVTAGFESITSR
jgi:F-type H+-transporting ATPase subunit gamma